jgi:hypothetical protein
MNKKMLIGLIAGLLLAVPAVSIAGDRFSDVPSSHTFHDDIRWLADRGVTRGCNPPANTQFCPDDDVTRGQMAAFMRRFANTSQPLLVGSENSGRVVGHETWVALDSANVTVPADGGALMLNGSAIFFINNDTDTGAVGLLEVTVDQGCSNSSTGVFTFWETLTIGADSATVVGSLPVSRGTHTVRLCALASHLNASERTQAFEPRVSALWAADGRVTTLGADASDEAMSKSAILERLQKLADQGE